MSKTDTTKESNDPKHPSVTPIAPSYESVTPYAVTAVILLIILCAAILTPDYLNYRYRVVALTTASKNQVTPIKSSEATKQPASTSPNALQYIASSETTSMADVPIKTSDMFEVYGKLVTMLLGFISIIGVLFGYFVRRSLREVEDDIRGAVEHRVVLWEKEKDALSTSTKEQLGQAREELNAFKKMKEEGERLVKALGEIEKAETEKKPVTPSAVTVTNAIDNDPTIATT
jgi:hypothetical protein